MNFFKKILWGCLSIGMSWGMALAEPLPVNPVGENGTTSGVMLQGGVHYHQGKDGNFLEFDGRQGSRVEIPFSADPAWFKQVSLSFRFMLTARPENDVRGKKRDCATIISRDWSWRFVVSPTLFTKAVMIMPSGCKELPGPGITLNTWYHVVVVYSANPSSFVLYLNGNAAAEEKNGRPSELSPRTPPVLLGEDPDHYNSFQGRICDVKILPRAVSAAEAEALYRAVPGSLLREKTDRLQNLTTALQQLNSEVLGPDRRAAVARMRQTVAGLLTGNNPVAVFDSAALVREMEQMNAYPAAKAQLEHWQMALTKNTPTATERDLWQEMREKLHAELQQKDFSAVPFVTHYRTLMAALTAHKIDLKDTLCYVVRPISGTPCLPDTDLPIRELGTALNAAAAPGEYEAVSFVLRPGIRLDSLQFQISALTGPDGHVIAASQLNLKLVKCWYQAGSAWQDIVQCKTSKVLVPELLLNDPALVKVDRQRQMDYLRLNFPTGTRYLPVSNPEPGNGKDRWWMSMKTADFPVYDAPSLLPVDLEANQNQQFWLTVQVPATARSGTYTGQIAVRAKSGVLGTLPITLKVLPFQLAAPRTHYDPRREFTSSIYYVSVIDPASQGDLTPFHKTESQYRAELKNLYAHGITNPLCYQLQGSAKMNPWNWDEFRKVLELRRQVGMATRPLYLSGPESNLRQGTASTPEALAQIKCRVGEILRIVESVYGHRDVFFYGVDEAKGEQLRQQRPAWQTIHEAGGKVLVASCDDKGNLGSFRQMGDLQDLVVYSGPPLASEAARWHSKQHRIWSYSNPQGGVENPEIYRRNYGLLLYLNNYDGAATYCYYESFGNPWDDFDHPSYRDHNLVYPTADGIIDTIAWEGYREAIDDIRYATTLREAAAAARQKGKVQLADQAEEWLNAIDAEHADLDAVRTRMIDWILKLKKA